MQGLGEGLGQAVGQGGADDGGIVVTGGFIAGGDRRLAVTGGDGEAADVVCPLPHRRDEVGEGGVGAALGLGHLLAQAVEAGAFHRAGLVGPDDHVVAVGVGWPQADHAPRLEPALVDDGLQHGRGVGVQAAGHLSDHVVVQNGGKAPDQFPGREERRPVNIAGEIGEVPRRECSCTGERRSSAGRRRSSRSRTG